jgi:hypothetical protein
VTQGQQPAPGLPCLGAGGPTPASALAAEGLEVPRPLRLFLTAGWSLTESVGLPAAAYILAAWLDGRGAGLVAGLVAIWLTAVIRKVATGSVPSLACTASSRGRPGCGRASSYCSRRAWRC